MVEIKGKFIMLVGSFMGVYPTAMKEADAFVRARTGSKTDELDPEGWYDIELYQHLAEVFANASPSGERAYITLGKRVYPTIKKTVGFPPGLETPLDYIEFENRGYQENIRGPGIKDRQIEVKGERRIQVTTVMHEQDCRILEGVYLGILKLAGVEGTVAQTVCIRKGDPKCSFDITWE